MMSLLLGIWLCAFTEVFAAVDFVRYCDNPLIVEHREWNSHDYCSHVCGIGEGLYTMYNCTEEGLCLCRQNCTNDEIAVQTPVIVTGGGICPPFATDPDDPFPEAEKKCNDTCKSICIGGIGAICGESRPLGPVRKIYTKICSCYCPPIPCTSNTTDPTMHPPTTKQTTTDQPDPGNLTTTNFPTTNFPTTNFPTTNFPTTNFPTTNFPTTNFPTTNHPTTEIHTTEIPPTDVPTTNFPTTENTTPEPLDKCIALFMKCTKDVLCATDS